MLIRFPNMTITWSDQSKDFKDIFIPVTECNGWYYIKAKDWAPGVWAGSEGLKVWLNNKYVMISCIDMQNHRIKVI